MITKCPIKNCQKYICGYVPIDFEADLKNGNTRKIKNKKNQDKLNELRSRIDKNYINIYKKWKELKPRKYKLK